VSEVSLLEIEPVIDGKLWRLRYVRLERFPNDCGNVPENWLMLRSREFRLVIPPNISGTLPLSALPPKLKLTRWVKRLQVLGRAPVNLLVQR